MERGKTVYTSVWKEPVQGRRLVGRLNIDGDAQGDLAGHGGEHRAVFVYQKYFICSRRPHGLLGSQVPAPAGARGSLRRPGAAESWPDRSLPYLRVWVDFADRFRKSVEYDPGAASERPAVGNLLICCSRPREDLAIDI